MPSYVQTNRPMKLTTPLGADKLLLVSYQGHEAISQMFRFDLQTVWTDRASLLPFDELLGKKVTIEISPSVNKRYINGMVSRITQGVKDENFVHYTLEIVPMCWMLDRKLDSRTFQQITIPDILKKLFAGIDVDYKIEGTFEPREYCVNRSKTCRRLLERKFFYLFTCEYCFSHYVTVFFLIVTRFQLLLPGWRGYVIAFFALVFVANAYMNLYARLRVDITSEKKNIEIKEKQVEATAKDIEAKGIEIQKLEHELNTARVAGEE